MGRGVAQILLVVFMFPLAVTVFAFAGDQIDHVMDFQSGGEWAATGIVTWAVVGVYWLMLWRKSVLWTRVRIIHSIALTLATPAGVAMLMTLLYFGALAVQQMRYGIAAEHAQEAFYITGAVLTPLVWLIGTILIWRDTTAERLSSLKGSAVGRLECPNCGYNLSGLSEARCPECGSQYTLDQLVAAQRGTSEDRATLTRA